MISVGVPQSFKHIRNLLESVQSSSLAKPQYLELRIPLRTTVPTIQISTHHHPVSLVPIANVLPFVPVPRLQRDVVTLPYHPRTMIRIFRRYRISQIRKCQRGRPAVRSFQMMSLRQSWSQNRPPPVLTPLERPSTMAIFLIDLVAFRDCLPLVLGLKMRLRTKVIIAGPRSKTYQECHQQGQGQTLDRTRRKKSRVKLSRQWTCKHMVSLVNY